MTELEFYQSIGKRIKDFRKAKKLTQSEVSTLAEVDRSMLARLESAGEGIKSADIIRRIVEATGHTMTDLFTEPAQKKTAFTSSSQNLCPS
jgi:transcriptional regulator with XRE-family HTH domain